MATKELKITIEQAEQLEQLHQALVNSPQQIALNAAFEGVVRGHGIKQAAIVSLDTDKKPPVLTIQVPDIQPAPAAAKPAPAPESVRKGRK